MLELDFAKGLLHPARQLHSPNYNERPFATEIDLLVIHNISLPEGKFGTFYIDALFTNTLDPMVHASFAQIAPLKVSAHLLIDRAGQITQYVPFIKRAWHAGVSTFMGRENCNDYSIGIELEGTGHEPYSELQYQRLIEVTKLIQRHYPLITKDHIVGHSDIAPGRKTDPGPSFDWQHYITHL